MRRVPWKTLLRHGPTIVDAARVLYGSTRPPAEEAGPDWRGRDDVEALRQRVEHLEQREAEQAALFTDLARQAQEMAAALEVLRARVHLAIVGSSVAVVLAVLTAAFVLWRG